MALAVSSKHDRLWWRISDIKSENKHFTANIPHCTQLDIAEICVADTALLCAISDVQQGSMQSEAGISHDDWLVLVAMVIASIDADTVATLEFGWRARHPIPSTPTAARFLL